MMPEVILYLGLGCIGTILVLGIGFLMLKFYELRTTKKIVDETSKTILGISSVAIKYFQCLENLERMDDEKALKGLKELSDEITDVFNDLKNSAE